MRTRHVRDMHAQRGAALLMAVMYLAVLGLLAGTFFSMLHRRMDSVREREQHQICLNLAEAGVSKAVAILRSGNRSYTGEQATSLGDGQFSVAVVPGQGSGVFHITGTASLTTGAVQRRPVQVKAELRLDGQGHVQRLYWQEATP